MEVSEQDRTGTPQKEAAPKVAMADPRAEVRLLIAQCRDVALKIARSLCREGWGDPEDLVNEIVERALMSADQLAGIKKDKFQAWLNVALTNRFISWCRNRTTERGAADQLRSMETDTAHSPEEAHLRAGGDVSRERFQQAVNELDPNQRQCLLLHLTEGLKYREIAEQLKTTTGTVGWWISEAKRHLRERFLGRDGAKS